MGVYSPGGHYLPHYDDFDILDPQAFTPDGTWVGNRIATAMAYLSDVQGGSSLAPTGTVYMFYVLRQEDTRHFLIWESRLNQEK